MHHCRRHPGCCCFLACDKHVKKLWDVMRGASSHGCGSQGDNTGTGRMRRPCRSHAPSLSSFPFRLSPAQQNRLAACSSLLAVCGVYLGSGGLCLYQDTLIVTASPTSSEAPTARHTAASSRRHHHSPEAYPRVWSRHPPCPSHRHHIDTLSHHSYRAHITGCLHPCPPRNQDAPSSS